MPPISVTPGHVAQMRQRQRRLARQQDQRTAFLQLHRGGAGQQVVVQPMRDGRKAAHRTGCDDHARHRIRPRGDAGAQIADAMQPGRQGPASRASASGPISSASVRSAMRRKHQVDLDPDARAAPRAVQRQRRTGRAGNPQNDPGLSLHPRPMARQKVGGERLMPRGQCHDLDPSRGSFRHRSWWWRRCRSCPPDLRAGEAKSR